MKRLIAYKGFTLIEAVIATVILGITAAAVVAPFASGMSVREVGMQRTLGAKLAVERMEELLAVDYDEVIGYDGYIEQQGQLMDGDVDYGKFSRAVECEDFPLRDNGGCVLITVMVYYDGAEVAQVRRLRTED